MVKIVVRRAARKYRAQTLSGHAGQNSAELSTRGLRRGRYTLSVTPEGGKAVQATFTL